MILNDFEHGIKTENSVVSKSFLQWASGVADSKLVVDCVRGSPIYSGVNAFINFHAIGEMEQHFQLSATLEAVDTYDGKEAFYIRHLTISRVGAVAVVPPAVPTPKAITPRAPSVPAAEPAAAPKPEVVPQVAALETGPLNWKERVAGAKASTEAPSKCVRVVVSTATAPTKVVAGAASKDSRRKDSPKMKESAPKREKRQPESLGDRLMFNIDVHVDDEDIKAALGPLKASLVSLRNNSATGHVFMDFSEGANAYEEMKKNPLVIGKDAKKVSVFRQRPRDGKE